MRSKTNTVHKVGIDNRDESGERYAETGGSHLPEVDGGRERKFQEQERGLKPLRIRRENRGGFGSKAEGAFGTDGTKPNDPENVRYRRDEAHNETDKNNSPK